MKIRLNAIVSAFYFLLFTFYFVGTANAEHAAIKLRVFRVEAESGKTLDEANAVADEEPPAGGINPRAVFKVKSGDPLVMQFILTNAYPHGELKDVTVRYFVARIDKVGQKKLPDLQRGTITEGRFNLNLKPKARVGARVAFTIREPGVYLLRVHTLNTKSDHEHISAIDLLVE
jgi:hypothetical protein